MAKDQSFDIVSEVDMQEVDNAVQQASREISQRYDLKDSHAEITLDKHASTLSVKAPSDFVARQVVDLLHTKLVQRKVDLKALTWGKMEPAAGSTVRTTAAIVNGIEESVAKRISKDVRDGKFKAKSQVEGDKLRISSSSRDELQRVMALVRGNDYGIPLQFSNYR